MDTNNTPEDTLAALLALGDGAEDWTARDAIRFADATLDALPALRSLMEEVKWLREQLNAVKNAEPDWWWRDLDPDDSGQDPGEAINNWPVGTVHLLRSSFQGPEKYAVEVPIPHPEYDDTETLLFDTEEEAKAVAKERLAALSRLGGK